FFICDNNYNIPNIKYLIIIFKLPILVFLLADFLSLWLGCLHLNTKINYKKNTTVILSVVICILTVLLIGPNEFKTNIANHQ
ncbi:hypothetical protein CBL21_27015, partial [Shigella flexneri]